LDEPTTGLDPKTRLAVWALIDKIRTETGMTVFLTTHYLEEAEKATDVVIMDKGNIIAHGTPNELKNRYSNDVLVSYMPRSEEFDGILDTNDEKYFYDEESGAYKITLNGTSSAKRMLTQYDKYTQDVEILKGKMDDVFLNVTGKDIKVAGEEDESEQK
jgi:multidrug/hemolysin transport system ATP-binding protein